MRFSNPFMRKPNDIHETIHHRLGPIKAATNKGDKASAKCAMTVNDERKSDRLLYFASSIRFAIAQLASFSAAKSTIPGRPESRSMGPSIPPNARRQSHFRPLRWIRPPPLCESDPRLMARLAGLNAPCKTGDDNPERSSKLRTPFRENTTVRRGA